ncbi:MAG: branched-chain amino acid ABC transporter permease [Chloroflexi bacterium]|nr:MAG: branched-chain amino acid ABC transporter permease [Chloroflexota bacterium]
MGSANPLVMLITSVGLAFILRNALLFIWGPEPKKFLLPSQQGLHLGPFIITPIQLLIVGLALVIMVAIYLMLTYTSLGQAIRGTADNPNLARIRGINTENVTSWVWFYSYVLSGLAGVMVGVVTVLNPSMGIHLLLVLFASVIMGGIGNPYGAVVAAMIIGITMEVAPAVPVLAPYKVVVAYLLMILVILFRPKGLFAK